MRGLSENLQCKNPSFFINWLDPFDLSKRKKLSDLCYICPRGTREGMPLCIFEKSVFVKHPNVHCTLYTVHCTVHICSVHISPNCSVMPSAVAVETLQCISCQFLPVAKREPCCNNCQLLVQAELESGQWLTKAANPAEWDPGGDPSCHTVRPKRGP